jgi:anti-sigma factor RsiW
MADRHVTALFSEAYDGLLDDAARHRFDEHLAACPACAADFARFSGSVDALRALPAARMPVAVRLPATPPAAERTGLIDALRERLRGRPPLAALAFGGLAAVAATALVVAVAERHTSSPPSLAQALQSGAGSFSAAWSGSNVDRGAAAAPAPAAAAPADFPYAVTVPLPGHPDQVLVLATQRQTYAAGDQVTILARVQTSGGSAKALAAAPPSVPDVRVLANVGSPATTAAGPAPAGAASADSPRNALLQAPAAAPAGRAADGLPLLSVTLPSSLQHGQVVTLVALLPDSQGQLQLAGVLTLTIS